MFAIKAGDYVGRKSYGMDIVFHVKRIDEPEPGSAARGTAIALLRAFEVRLMASAPVEDLVVLAPERFKEVISRSEANMSRRIRSEAARAIAAKDEPGRLPGRVLHIDGDQEYLGYCMKYYTKLGIEARGVHVPESEQPEQVGKLIEQYQPDMIVITGHDGYSRKKWSANDLDHYYHSRYFVEAVRNARLLRPDKDSLVIFAGACQSHYEAILNAGANFASSPERKLINCYDPVLVAEKVCFTPLGKTADIVDVIDNTITGREGIGGIETRGLMRTILPGVASAGEDVAAPPGEETKQAATPAAKPAVKPATKSVAKPAVKPAAKPTAKPAVNGTNAVAPTVAPG